MNDDVIIRGRLRDGRQIRSEAMPAAVGSLQTLAITGSRTGRPYARAFMVSGLDWLPRDVRVGDIVVLEVVPAQ